MTALTVKQAAEELKVTEETVRYLIHTTQLPAFSVSRNPNSKKPRYRITKEALEAFKLCRAHTTPPPRTQKRKRELDVIEFYK